jgi:hypothetical protein
MRSSGSARHSEALDAPIRLGRRLAFACWLLTYTGLHAQELPRFREHVITLTVSVPRNAVSPILAWTNVNTQHNAWFPQCLPVSRAVPGNRRGIPKGASWPQRNGPVPSHSMLASRTYCRIVG